MATPLFAPRVQIDVGIIAATTKVQVNLQGLLQEFGRQGFNCLIMTNTSTENIKVHLDATAFIVLLPNETKGFDGDWGVHFTQVELENLDAVDDTAADEIFVSVGNTKERA